MLTCTEPGTWSAWWPGCSLQWGTLCTHCSKSTMPVLPPVISGCWSLSFQPREQMKSLEILTWKCGLETHLAICLKSGSWILTNWAGSITSRISSISPKNITLRKLMFWEHSKQKAKENYLLLRTCLGPKLQEPLDHLYKIMWKLQLRRYETLITVILYLQIPVQSGWRPFLEIEQHSRQAARDTGRDSAPADLNSEHRKTCESITCLDSWLQHTLCRGMSTLTRNCLCSALSGSAKPLIMLPRISNSSPTPLKCSVS